MHSELGGSVQGTVLDIVFKTKDCALHSLGAISQLAQKFTLQKKIGNNSVRNYTQMYVCMYVYLFSIRYLTIILV